jgi:hypothetical protein
MAAHIKGAAPGSARYDEGMTPEQRRSPENGIWMCMDCGTLVDKDATAYPEPLLREWKRGAEEEARSELVAPRGKASHAFALKLEAPAVPPQEDSRPWLVATDARGSQLYRAATRQYLFYILQVWFENEPNDQSAVAEHLTATLSFLRQGGVPLFPDVQGEWALANAADNVGFGGTLERLPRLLPVGERAKLLIVQKRTEDDIAFAWSKGAGEYDGRRHPSHQIPPGTYELRVRVRGIKIDRLFKFILVNPGAGGDPRITHEVDYA